MRLKFIGLVIGLVIAVAGYLLLFVLVRGFTQRCESEPMQSLASMSAWAQALPLAPMW